MQVIRIENSRSSIDIHNEAVAVAKDIKTNHVRMFERLIEVESRQIYYEFEVPSLYVYCAELLELSKQSAKDFICVVRKSLEVPELAEAIRSGKVSIAKARKVCSVVTSENHEDWIALAIHCSCRIVERAVAMANPKAAVEESLSYVSGDAMKLTLGVSEEWGELLVSLKDLMSQKERRAVSSEEALFVLMNEYRRKNDPVEKAKRAARKSGKSVSKSSEQVEPNDTGAKPKTRYRPMSVEHQVDLRDGGQCTFVDRNGKRRESRRWLEKHHLVEFAQGGRHKVENLVTLCSAHHKIRHLQLAKNEGVT